MSSVCSVVFSGADLNGSVSGQVGSGDTFAEVLLNLPCCGNWNLNFEPVDGGFEFVHGTFTAGTPPAPVPEPGALGLVAIGLAGAYGLVRRKQTLSAKYRYLRSRPSAVS